MKPMENIRVVELSTMLAGPMTARILAEWGADVVKVESVNGDAWRKQAGTTLSPCTKDANPNFDVQNMNKRFVCLNLRTEAGRDAMMKLLSGADIFITNYRVQALEPMGLTYEQLKETFPRLIHASVLGYGSEGPESSRPGYDYTVFFARTGLMADLAPAGGPPLIPVGGIGDHSVAVALSGGIAAALYKRSVTGEGDKVDVSLLQAGTFINCTGILNGFNGRKLPRDRYDCGHAGSNTYQGSDGEWFYLAIIDYRRFPEFCQVIGMPEIAADPRFSTSDVYYENRGELTKILDKKFAEQPVSYWHELPRTADGSAQMRFVTMRSVSMNSKSDVKEAAFQAMTVYCSAAVQIPRCKTQGEVPVVAGAASSPDYLDDNHPYLRLAEQMVSGKDGSVQIQVPVYLPQYTEIQSEVEPMIQKVMAGSMSAKDLLDQWAKLLEAAKKQFDSTQG